MKKTFKILSVLLISALILISAVSCQTTKAPKGPDKDGSYTSMVYYTGDDEGKLTVRYLGLKQYANETYPGDCAIYTSPEGLVMMVDCGNQISYQEIIPILDQMGIEKIDIFVMSHCHADHIGSFSSIAKKYPIGKLYTTYVNYTSGTFQGAMQTAKDLNLDTEILYEGDSFMFGNDVKVEVFWPYEGQTVNMSDAGLTNASSTAMKLTYKDSTFWTSGDLYVEQENELIKKYGDILDCDVMKMNHHGRETSNGKDFINAVSPKLAVAMQGEFSSQTIFNWYRTSKVTPFHTLFDGTVKVSTPGDGTYDVQCQYIRTQKKLYGTPAEDGHYTF